jgi:hypothetical protein
MFLRYQLDPTEEFTLTYGQNYTDQSSQYMTVSSQQRKLGQFDEFIERFGAI